MYFEQDLLAKRLNLAIGRLSTGNDFATSDLFSNYVNAAVNGNPFSLSLNAPSFSSDPVASWGFRAIAKPTDEATTLARCARLPRARLVLGQVRRLLASPELVARTTTAVRQGGGEAEDVVVEEGKVIEALAALEPVWDELYPAEQARILRLLIERIEVAPDGISVTLHAAGIRSLVAELAEQEAPAPAASEPELEAAE
jgi:hypothetical protein